MITNMTKDRAAAIMDEIASWSPGNSSCKVYDLMDELLNDYARNFEHYKSFDDFVHDEVLALTPSDLVSLEEEFERNGGAYMSIRSFIDNIIRQIEEADSALGE